MEEEGAPAPPPSKSNYMYDRMVTYGMHGVDTQNQHMYYQRITAKWHNSSSFRWFSEGRERLIRVEYISDNKTNEIHGDQKRSGALKMCTVGYIVQVHMM